MISGPTLPNSLSGLRELLAARADLIEHGLRILTEDLVLGREGSVDALACDAGGAAVLLFAATTETSLGLPARLRAADAWWRQNAGFLAGELADAELRVDAPPRFFVIGQDLLADTLDELRRMVLAGLAVAQLCSFSVGGRLRMGLTLLIASDVPQPVAARHGFSVPVGITDPGQRALAARFLDLMRKVDAAMTATGDRFVRRVSLDGQPIAQIGLRGGRMFVEFRDAAAGTRTGAGAESIELTDGTCLAVVDRILRLVLEREAAAPAPQQPVVQNPAVVAESVRRSTTPPTQTPSPGAPADEDRYSLEPIRRTVAQAQLSREEFSALGDAGSHSD